MLTKEEKLAILSKAIDEGARIDVSFHRMVSKEAEARINEYAEMMSSYAVSCSHNTSHWHKARTGEFNQEITVSTFYEDESSDYMEEDVVFEGVEVNETV